MPKPVQQKLRDMLGARQKAGNLRELKIMQGIDFCSNDYLGLTHIPLPSPSQEAATGSTGSRLISGHDHNTQNLEQEIAQFHKVEAALLFGSGYSANLGLLSAIGAKEDVFLCDELIHASLIDGARLSYAKRVRFAHNDIADLEAKLTIHHPHTTGTLFVIVESVYSMDGDIAPLAQIASLCERFNAALIVDEAHAIGLYGQNGCGVINALGLTENIFAGVYTYGKAMGLHGAAITGSAHLINYLINFCRPFIYSTALPPQTIHDVRHAYKRIETAKAARAHLTQNIEYFQKTCRANPIQNAHWLESQTPIQGLIIPGNEQAKKLADELQKAGFSVKAILSPTVALGQERLRLCLHSYNTYEEMDALMTRIVGFFKETNK